MPDVDAEKVTLEPDSVSFMGTLISREHAEAGLQNGFSPISLEEDCSDAIRDRQIKAEDEEKASAPSERICPVGLHKAVLLYPPSTQNIVTVLFCCPYSYMHSAEISVTGLIIC